MQKFNAEVLIPASGQKNRGGADRKRGENVVMQKFNC